MARRLHNEHVGVQSSAERIRDFRFIRAERVHAFETLRSELCAVLRLRANVEGVVCPHDSDFVDKRRSE
jgi:hypothetical protein